MHHAYLTLLAAGVHETSKTAFYLLGGGLAAWAVIVSAIGFTKPDFPGESGGSRVVIAITSVLVVGAMASAVLTASTPAPAAPFMVKGTGYAKGSAPAPTPAGQSAAVASPATPAPAAPPGTLALAADKSGQLMFDKKALSATAGKVTINFTNDSPIAHNLTLLRGSATVSTPTFSGGTRTLSTKLAPGKYQFICTVPGHAQAGMMGTLTVN